MTARPELVKIEEAALELSVPKKSLETAARRHGLLIRMGRAVRIDRNCYGELIEACREKPQEQGSTNAPTPGYSSSATPVAPIGQQALATAAMLKRRSRPTSPEKAQFPAVVTRIGSQ